MSTRSQVNVNLPLGITEYGEVVMVDYFFIHSPSFRGVTGSTFRPVSAEEYATAEDVEAVAEAVEDMWRTLVSESGEIRGLTEYAQSIINHGEAESTLWDESSSEHHDALREADPSLADAATFDCTGGGRMFGRDGLTFSTVFDPVLLSLVTRMEDDTLDHDGAHVVLDEVRAHLDRLAAV